MTKNFIIAVTGFTGSGKSLVTDFLIKKGLFRIYFGDVTFDEMKRLNIEINEKNERWLREKIRKDHGGTGAYAKFIIPKVKKAIEEHDIVLESLYSWEEYTAVKESFPDNFFVIAVHAPFGIRVQRMKNRVKRPLTEEELISRDYSQIENLHQAGPIAYADFHIINTTTSEHVYSEAEKILKKVQERFK